MSKTEESKGTICKFLIKPLETTGLDPKTIGMSKKRMNDDDKDGMDAREDSKKKFRLDCFQQMNVRGSKSVSEKRRGSGYMVNQQNQSMDLRSYFGSGEAELPRELDSKQEN